MKPYKLSETTPTTMTGRSHHGAAGGLPQNHIFSGGRQVLSTERWNCNGKLSFTQRMEHFEKLALDSAQHKASLWLRCVEDTFVVWPRGPERLQDFLSHLNSFRPFIQFTMEIDSVIALLRDRLAD
jgi:hypothetical protein